MGTDFTKLAEKMLGGQNLTGNTNVNINPLIDKLRELKALAAKYQTGTPAKLDFGPLILKLKDAEAIGYKLQAKARSGQL